MAAPQVIISEVDQSQRVASFPGVYCGLVIPNAIRGPVNEPILITSEADLLRVFSIDDTVKVGSHPAYYAAIVLLQGSDKLWVIRPKNTGLLASGVIINKTGTTPVSAAPSTGIDDINTYTFGADNAVMIYARDPGKWGNRLSVSITLPDAPAVEFAGHFNIFVKLDNLVVETFKASRQNIKDGFGASVFIEDVLKGSRYIFGKSNPLVTDVTQVAATVSVGSTATATSALTADAVTSVTVTSGGTNYTSAPTVTFAAPTSGITATGTAIIAGGLVTGVTITNPGSGYSAAPVVTFDAPAPVSSYVPLTLGADGTSATSGQIIQAYQLLRSPDNYPLTLLLDAGNEIPEVQTALAEIAEYRKDSVALLSMPYQVNVDAVDYINDNLDYRRNTLNLNSSYVALYSPHVKIYDKYTDKEVFVGQSAFAAVAINFSFQNYELWYPAAGFTRGLMLTARDLQKRFTKGEMGTLYDAGINPGRFAAGKGIAIWGQKTLSYPPSKRDRLNVRLLLCVIEPAIADYLEGRLFDLNLPEIRFRIVTVISDYLTGIQARDGLYAFRVQCDDLNNFAEDIDNYRLNVDIFVQPTASIEEIRERVIITRTGVSFSA